MEAYGVTRWGGVWFEIHVQDGEVCGLKYMYATLMKQDERPTKGYIRLAMGNVET